MLACEIELSHVSLQNSSFTDSLLNFFDISSLFNFVSLLQELHPHLSLAGGFGLTVLSLFQRITFPKTLKKFTLVFGSNFICGVNIILAK